MEFNHYPVMLKESIELLNIKSDGTYLDCTLGGGSHSEAILEKLDSGQLVAFDKDQDAITHSKQRLAKYEDKLIIVKDDYKNANDRLDEIKIDKLDGFLMDLGISSYQIDNAIRGFSYINDAPLDMRMDKTHPVTAFDVVNAYKEEDLREILFKWGEESFAKNIAKNIVKERQVAPIKSTIHLAKIVEESIPEKFRWKNGHPAKKTFQAIRIEVNEELNGLMEIIESLSLRLKAGGRGVIISFHSLEDRIVKRTFIELAKNCICPPKQPICTCDKRQEVKILTNKPIVASKEELEINKRSQSAKLRSIERI